MSASGTRKRLPYKRRFVLALLECAFSAVLLPGVPTVAHSQWTQWRGPERDGSVPGDARIGDWLPQAVMLWQREVGDGYSGPIVKGDHICLHTRKGGQEVVASLTIRTGKTVWSRHYDAPFKQDPAAKGHGLGPYSTPTLADGRLFTLGVVSVLSAWDAEKGILLWRREYSSEFDPSYPYFGMCASPLVWSNLCVVHFGHPGWQKPGKGAIVALRVSDGSEMWRWDDDGPAVGASPVMAVIEGKLQIVFKTQENIVGLDPRTGKQLWRIPFEVSLDNTIVTPLVIGNRLLTSDYEKGFHAWQIQSKGEFWTVQKLWKNRAVSLFTSSPVVSEGQVVGFSNLRKGQLFGLEPSDGRVLWRGESKWGEHASLIAWGDQLLVFKEDGSLVVGKVSRKGFLAQRRYRLGSSRMWCHPAIVDGQIIIKDGNRLKVYRLRG